MDSVGLEEASTDPGWAELTEFLGSAGLVGGALSRVLTLLVEEDVTNLKALRLSFERLPFKAGSRSLICDALEAAVNSAPPVAAGATQLLIHTFYVNVTFKQETATLRLSLPTNVHSTGCCYGSER